MDLNFILYNLSITVQKYKKIEIIIHEKFYWEYLGKRNAPAQLSSLFIQIFTAFLCICVSLKFQVYRMA